MKSRFAAAVLALVAVAILFGTALWLWVADDEARVSRLNAAFNYGLLAGAIVGSTGLFRQVYEARRSREDALRPVLIVTDVFPNDEETGMDPARLLIQNIGPGPALKVRVDVWLAPGPLRGGDREGAIEKEGLDMIREGGSPELHYPWPFHVPAGGRVSVPVWRLGPGSEIHRSDRIRFRLVYVDVFGNQFVEPVDGTLGHDWARDDLLLQAEGDYELHLL